MPVKEALAQNERDSSQQVLDQVLLSVNRATGMFSVVIIVCFKPNSRMLINLLLSPIHTCVDFSRSEKKSTQCE